MNKQIGGRSQSKTIKTVMYKFNLLEELLYKECISVQISINGIDIFLQCESFDGKHGSYVWFNVHEFKLLTLKEITTKIIKSIL